MSKNNKQKSAVSLFFENTKVATAIAVILLVVLFAAVFIITLRAVRKNNMEANNTEFSVFDETDTTAQNIVTDFSSQNIATDLSPGADLGQETVQAALTTTVNVDNTTSAAAVNLPISDGTIPYPSDTVTWQMICLNKNRCVDSSYEASLSLSYVAGSGERMDSRAAKAYEEMYSAAANDGIYLTPCSGYRSYSTQKRLYYEFYDEYIAQGYSESEAHRLTSRRRNPAGSSEHNIGICMDIICASSSANFENTSAYAWLQNNAQDYGYILRYPEDKENITGVKFEPWHWRYVGVENAPAIKNSGLCLEEYLGLA